MVAAWSRENYVAGGGEAQVALIALSRTKLADPLPISRSKHGMPDSGDGPDAVEVVPRERATDPAEFVADVLEPFVDLVVGDLGPEAAATALLAEYAYVIMVTLRDPDDLGHLQAAWALAKCVCEAGAELVIDVYAVRAHLGGEVAALAPDRAFDVMHEVTLFFEEEGTGTLAAWTLGLRKFGRPDLVIVGVAPDDATETAVLLRDVAATLASGERIEPGDRVGAPGGRVLTAERFEHAASPAVAVDGDAILLR